MKRRVLIASGATGGHFYPAFSVGLELMRQGEEVLFLLPSSTRRRGVEVLDQIERSGMHVLELDVEAFPRRPGLSMIRFWTKLARAVATLRNVVRSWEPRVVLGMGSYLSFPAVVAAYSMGVPVLLHEQNAKLGLANRASFPFATRLAMGLPILSLAPSARTLWTGIPIRSELSGAPEARRCREALGLDPEKKTVLAFGGSQGARGINTLLPEAFELLSEKRPGEIQLIHLSGRKHFEQVRDAYPSGGGAKVLDYVDDMSRVYRAADLVLSRSGAGTLAELQTFRIPAVLVPFPYATGKHQDANAEVLERVGAVRVLQERDLDARSLAGALEEILFGTARAGLSGMRKAFRRSNFPGHDEAAGRLARLAGKMGAGELPVLWV